MREIKTMLSYWYGAYAWMPREHGTLSQTPSVVRIAIADLYWPSLSQMCRKWEVGTVALTSP